MAATTSTNIVSEKMLIVWWKILGCGFLMIALTILYRTLPRTRSPFADLKLALGAAKQTVGAVLERPQVRAPGPSFAQLLAEHRESRWAAFIWFHVGSPLAALQPIVFGSACLHIGYYIPLGLIMVVFWTVVCLFFGALLLARMCSLDLDRIFRGSLFTFTYIGIGVLPALAPTLQVYSFIFPGTVIAHSFLLQLAPDAMLLVILEALHLVLALWTVRSAPFMEGIRVPHGVLCFVACGCNLFHYCIAEGFAVELVKSWLVAREAQAKAHMKAHMNELLVMMSDAVVAVDHDLTFMDTAPKLAAMLCRTTLEAGTSLRQLLVPSEEERVIEFMTSESATARQLLTDFQDTRGRRVPVRMYHVRFNDAIADLPLHLLGLVEEGSAREPVEVADSVSALVDFSRVRRQVAGLSCDRVGRCVQRGPESSSSGSGGTESSIGRALGLVDVRSALRPASAMAGLADTLADFSQQRRQGRAGSHASQGGSGSSSSVSHGGAVRVSHGLFGAIQGEWVGCQRDVEEKLTTSATFAHRVLSSKLEVKAVGVKLINMDGEPQFVLPTLPSTYRRVGSGSARGNPDAGILRLLQGAWSGDHPSSPLMEIDETGIVKMEQTFQLESSVENGVLCQGQALATRRGKLYWYDPFLGDLRSYRRAPDHAPFDTSRWAQVGLENLSEGSQGPAVAAMQPGTTVMRESLPLGNRLRSRPRLERS